MPCHSVRPGYDFASQLEADCYLQPCNWQEVDHLAQYSQSAAKELNLGQPRTSSVPE